MDGTQAQKAEWLPQLASGEKMASFALTEPGAGSDAASIITTATRDGDVYRLNGAKRYITNAPRAGMFTVMARSEAGVKGAAGITAFILDAETPGISFGKPDKKMGQKGTVTCDVVFDDVAVPAENIIGGVPGRGFKTAMKVLDRGRIHLGALAAGMAHRLVHEQVAYAVERKQFGQAIGQFQLVQGMIADSRTDAYASLCMVTDVAAPLRRRREGLRRRGRDQILHQRGGGSRGGPGGADPRRRRLHQREQGGAFLPRRAPACASTRAPPRCSRPSSPRRCCARRGWRPSGIVKPQVTRYTAARY